MLCADARTYLNPSERQVFDVLTAKARRLREDEQRQALGSLQARQPNVRKPLSDRMRVGAW